MARRISPSVTVANNEDDYRGAGFSAWRTTVEIIDSTFENNRSYWYPGAVFYALHRPNPWPRWFGYHEIFHLFVIAGVAVHYVAVAFFAVPQATA